MAKKNTGRRNEKIFYVGKMGDRAEENQVFYICKNSNVDGAAHWHDCFEIEFIVEGTLSHILKRRKFRFYPHHPLWVWRTDPTPLILRTAERLLKFWRKAETPPIPNSAAEVFPRRKHLK